MTEEQIMTRLCEIFRDVFDDESITVDENTTAADIDGWDSIMHITLISEVEAAFSVRFAMKDVLSMQNVGDLARAVLALV